MGIAKKALARTILGLLPTLGLAPPSAAAADAFEQASTAVGVTVGNSIFLPAKAASLVIGTSAALASLLFGNPETFRQSLQNSFEGPYLVTPELARRAVGERPELAPR
jgi:hypothetical protein